VTIAGGARGVLAVGAVLITASTGARLVVPPAAAERGQIARAFEAMRRSVDPCGESARIVAVVEAFERCAPARYRIRIDPTASRNLLEPGSEDEAGTIIWNPALRSELEGECEEDPARAVLRDPVASLLHEMVHAVDDCEGRNPAARELEAVRVENVYRRAAGLCQRTAYGSHPLETDAIRCDGSRGRSRLASAEDSAPWRRASGRGVPSVRAP
jgi:hypothetical protein